jgi:ATP-dependent RNA helicase RhlE
VSLVCLDEEGFMYDIERFTKQKIDVKVIEGFGPEAGERAEPIAMGRQTIWGGAGKPPSREVMAAAAKAARTEMMQRIRDNKDKQGGGAPSRGAGAGPSGGGQAPRAANGGGGNGPRGNGPRNGPAPRGNGQGPRASAPQGRGFGGGGGHAGGGDRFDDSQPRHAGAHQAGRTPGNDHGAHIRGDAAPVYGGAPRTPGGQPDPLRTSVDSMADRGRRSGGGGRPGGSGGGGFNRGNRSYGR